jgi:subtilisin family serine protease
MRRVILLALACAALLPAQAVAAPMKAVIVHLEASPMPPLGATPREATMLLELEGKRAQAPVLAQLADLHREGHVRHVRSLWIASAVAVSADDTALAALRARPDVRSIEADSALPIQLAAVAGSSEPGIALTGAPRFWAQNVDGTGITVGILDTGADLTHPELALHFRGNRHDWFDPYGEHLGVLPVDMGALAGHGSQVTGVVVAGGGIGMAPGARFIAARAFNDAGTGVPSAIHLAFQWLLDPDRDPTTNDAPNIVNLSWGAAACSLEFQPDLQALRAVNILPVVAAGNDGVMAVGGLPPDNSPANLPEAFAVGAVDSATTIAPFSSRGPSSCDGGQFPALVAPGTNIRSTGLGGGDVIGAGTSFSAPHVAGALALLLQVAPQLTAAEQATLLTQSAIDLGAPGADSTFGAGLLDVVAAARLLHTPTLDFDPPVLSAVAHADVTLQLHANDAFSAVAGGEWWADTDPGVGAGQPFTAADGTFDSLSEGLIASTAALAPGPHLLGMRARDVFGNWSAATTLSISVPGLPTPLAAVPDVPAPAVPAAPAPPPAPALPFGSKLELVVSDGFEHGLGAWSRRRGRLATTSDAAMSGRRGMRARLVAGAPSFVQRHLPQAGSRTELAFDLNARSLSSAGAWIEIAVITSASGHRLASVDLRSLGGSRQLRLSASTGTGAGATVHSQRRSVRRRPTLVVLSLDSAQAGLAVDGVELGHLARAPHSAQPAGIVLGPWRGGPSASTGYLDFDRVTVREAPAAS